MVRENKTESPLVASCKGRPLLLSGHRLELFDSAVMSIVSALPVTVTVVEALRKRKLSIAFSPGLLPQFVPVVFDVRLLLQTTVVCL